MSGVNAAACAVNVWAYATWDNPLNLGAAVFCGLITIISAVQAR